MKYIGSDIQFLKTNSITFKKKNSYLLDSLNFYLVYIVSLLLFLVILFIRREQIKKNANVIRLKNRRARKVSRKRLKKSYKYLKMNNTEQFYDELLNALWGYLSDKLTISLSELTKDNVFDELSKMNIDKELQNELKEIIEACEMSRYAPNLIEGSTEDNYKRTAKVISRLEQKIK